MAVAHRPTAHRPTAHAPAAPPTAARAGPSPTARIVVVSSAARYRRLARVLPGPGDAVLEVGCSTGTATRLLAATGARVLAVDVSAEMVARTRAALGAAPRAAVAHLDGRDTSSVAALLPDPELVFLDAGGDARLDAVALLLRQLLLAFSPRVLVVRSAELAAVCAAVAEVEPPASGGEAALGRRRSRDARAHALESLLDLSQSASARDRAFAARKLRGHAGAAPARARLATLADDPDPRVRRIARAGPAPAGAPRPRRAGVGAQPERGDRR
jgi:SAM-dependent methyltransferase